MEEQIKELCKQLDYYKKWEAYFSTTIVDLIHGQVNVNDVWTKIKQRDNEKEIIDLKSF